MTMQLFRRRNSASLAIAALFLFGACATASGVRLGEQEFAARAQTHPVPVFESLNELPRAFVKVGRVVGEGGDFVSFADVVALMQQRARELGGDAIVLDGYGMRLSGDCDDGIDVDRTVRALAVRWK